MITVGTHKALKIGGDIGYTSKEAPQVALLFRLIETGDTITAYLYFTEKTEKRTLETLARLGVENDFSNIGEPSDVEVSLVIEEEADLQGELRLRVKWINFGDGVAMAKRMQDAERAAFAAKMAGKLAKVREGLGAEKDPWDR